MRMLAVIFVTLTLLTLAIGLLIVFAEFLAFVMRLLS